MSPPVPSAIIRRRGEFGGSAIKIIISVVVFLLLAQAAYVFVPIWVAVYDFESELEKEVRFGSQKTNAAIMQSLLAYAVEQQLPVGKENLKIDRTKGELKITANYTVPIATLFYTYNLERSVEQSAPLF